MLQGDDDHDYYHPHNGGGGGVDDDQPPSLTTEDTTSHTTTRTTTSLRRRPADNNANQLSPTGGGTKPTFYSVPAGTVATIAPSYGMVASSSSTASPSYAGGYYETTTTTTMTPLSSPYSPMAPSPSAAFPLTKSAHHLGVGGTTTLQPAMSSYRHNTLMACFLLPILAIIVLFSHHSHYDGYYNLVPLQSALVCVLIIYAFDLANLSHEGTFFVVWTSVIVNTMVAGWFWLLSEDTEEEDSGWIVLEIIFKVALTSLVLSVCAFWLYHIQVEQQVNNNNNNTNTTQQQSQQQDGSRSGGDITTNNNNNQQNQDQQDVFLSPRDMEALLHSLVPPAFAAFVSQWMTTSTGMPYEASAILAPHLFALCLTIGMLLVGSCKSSFVGNETKQQQQQQSSSYLEIHNYAIRSKSIVKGHVLLLLFTPSLMYLTTCMGRIWSQYTASDDWYDFLLTLTIPYLLWQALQSIHYNTTWTHPYNEGILLQNNNGWLNRILFTSPGNTTNGNNHIIWSFVPLAVASLVTSFALQQRYLIPICHSFSYHFMGTNTSNWMLTFYWTTATIAALFTSWVWGRPALTAAAATAVEEENDGESNLLFGDYQEDVIQIGLTVIGLCIGKAFGLPWNMTPLPILGTLGLTLWMSSRMLRYLAIFLFVLHATAVVVFTYRFVGIDSTIYLPTIPPIDLSLLHFGLVVTSASIIIGLTMGLAVRSNGGYLASYLKKAEAPGQCLIVYTLLLTILEITLLKRPIPTNELVGVETEEIEEVDDEMLYDPVTSYFTSLLIIGIAIFMKRVRITKKTTSSIATSLAIGKAIAIFIDSEKSTFKEQQQNDTRGTYVLFQSLITALLCIVIFAPRLFLEPVYIKTSTRYRRSMAGASDLPKETLQTIMVYAFALLPLTLILTIPYVLFPLVDVLAGGDAYYYSVRTPISELIGSTIALWGLSCLSMMNYYLPDGGGEVWKKLSALAFLMGISIFLAAPTLGTTAVVNDVASNPYASISSVGSQMILRSKSRTGGWGLVSAALATLLAVSGPLELRERRLATGRKDKYLLFRTMTFSMMFGGGVAWFITVQSMSDTQWLFLILTMTASMSLAFLGTVAAVLAYFLELQNFDEVEQMAKTCMLAFLALIPVAGIPQMIGYTSAHLFGAGGWLSTYLTVSCLASLSFAVALSNRTEKDKRTRGLGNISCIISWLFAIIVLYGRFGIAGLDTNYEVTTIFGVPASVFGTLLVAPILLVLEGETSLEARGRRVSVTTSHNHKASASMLTLNLPRLKKINRWFPSFVATLSVFLIASLHVILLRGMMGGSSVAQSHKDVFTHFFGSAKSSIDEDLAALAEKTVSHSIALSTAARLAGSGFWTAPSGSIFGPLLHLVGVVACVPSLYLLTCHWWLERTIPSSQVLLTLPLNTIPLFLCRGIPCLRVAAFCSIVAAVHQLVRRRQEEQHSRMRI